MRGKFLKAAEYISAVLQQLLKKHWGCYRSSESIHRYNGRNYSLKDEDYIHDEISLDYVHKSQKCLTSVCVVARNTIAGNDCPFWRCGGGEKRLSVWNQRVKSAVTRRKEDTTLRNFQQDGSWNAMSYKTGQLCPVPIALFDLCYILKAVIYKRDNRVDMLSKL